MVHHSEISIVLGSRKFSDVFANFRQQFTAQQKKHTEFQRNRQNSRWSKSFWRGQL